MADIFVSYAREDRPRVKPFIDLLLAQNWSVWWDRELVPGHTFENVIDSEITDASCVIVFWSKNSIISELGKKPFKTTNDQAKKHWNNSSRMNNPKIK